MGTYEGRITLNSNSTAEPVIEIRVQMQTLEQPVLVVSPGTLDFGQEETELPLEIQNTNNGTLVWEAEIDEFWLSLSALEGEVPMLGTDDLQATVRREGLPAGEYQAEVTVSSNGGNETILIRMEVPHTPQLSVDVASLDYGSSVIVRTAILRNTGRGLLSWQAAVPVDWCMVTPGEGGNAGRNGYAHHYRQASESFTGNIYCINDDRFRWG